MLRGAAWRSAGPRVPDRPRARATACCAALKQVRTVQGELEKAVSRVLMPASRCVGASRTDGGAHALGQVRARPEGQERRAARSPDTTSAAHSGRFRSPWAHRLGLLLLRGRIVYGHRLRNFAAASLASPRCGPHAARQPLRSAPPDSARPAPPPRARDLARRSFIWTPMAHETPLSPRRCSSTSTGCSQMMSRQAEGTLDPTRP